MGQVEREIKLLNVDVNKIKSTLKKEGIELKGKYIQDVYTFDLPTLDKLYVEYINRLIVNNDSRPIIKLISEVRPCFDKQDITLIKSIIGVEDLLEFIKNNNNKFNILNSEKLVNLMKKTNENFSKWVRLRKTGDKTTITIKRIIDSKGEYELDAVNELEFEVPDIETGRDFLEDLGFFFERHQIKMRMAYDYKNTEIVIDKWPKLKPYVEIEGPSKEEIEEAVAMLGFTEQDVIVINTDDVYKSVGIDIYSEEYKDLSFNEKETKEIKKYME